MENCNASLSPMLHYPSPSHKEARFETVSFKSRHLFKFCQNISQNTNKGDITSCHYHKIIRKRKMSDIMFPTFRMKAFNSESVVRVLNRREKYSIQRTKRKGDKGHPAQVPVYIPGKNTRVSLFIEIE